MGRLAQDAKNLILGNDGSDREPLDFKTELQNAIKAGLITKADGTLLITSRTNTDKLAELISRAEAKEISDACKEDGKDFDSPEESKRKKEKEEKEREEQRTMEVSLEQQIEASKNATKAKIQAEKNLEKLNEKERK